MKYLRRISFYVVIFACISSTCNAECLRQYKKDGTYDANETSLCFYAISDVLTNPQHDQKYGIELQSNTGTNDNNNHLIWRVEDFIAYSKLSVNDHYERESCRSSLYPHAVIIARGKWNKRNTPQVGEYMNPIKEAWRADLKLRKFVKISTKSVRCEFNFDKNELY